MVGWLIGCASWGVLLVGYVATRPKTRVGSWAAKGVLVPVVASSAPLGHFLRCWEAGGCLLKDRTRGNLAPNGLRGWKLAVQSHGTLLNHPCSWVYGNRFSGN